MAFLGSEFYRPSVYDLTIPALRVELPEVLRQQGGGLAMYPMYDYLPLSMDKAALRAMCLALHEEFKKQDVFLGTVTVTGVIAPGEKCDPALLAEDFWKLYTERRDCEIVHRCPGR